MRIAPAIELMAHERQQLAQWARGRRTPARLVLRAKIVLLAAAGHDNHQIAAAVATSRQTVGLWRHRFVTQRLPGLAQDAPRGGRPLKARQTLTARILKTTTQTKPPAATHWSTRTLARHLRTNPTFVQRVWKAHGLQPHRVRTFKLSRDPHFQDKLEDVVGLYLNPPEHAVVLCVDEKSQIQALDRTQPGLPLKPGRCGTLTHDYKRHGTTTLFAALNVAEGAIISTCQPRHRHQEWLRFLRLIDQQIPQDKALHLIADNYATHKHPTVQRWLIRHPRVHMHFTPTSSSWLNLVERVFGDLTAKQLRRGVFRSVPELIAAIDAYITQRNAHPTPFVWTKSAQEIVAKVNRAKVALDKTRTA
ncbi:MAG: IS630 family transposase [Nitrospira sp.]|nr:MAG: IS630 family transposase [Nitrospira sp.]